MRAVVEEVEEVDEDEDEEVVRRRRFVTTWKSSVAEVEGLAVDLPSGDGVEMVMVALGRGFGLEVASVLVEVLAMVVVEQVAATVA